MLLRSLTRRSMGLLVGLVLLPLAAQANPEFAVDYDARSLAMGGTGVAAARGATGIFHNPAAIASTDHADLVLTLSPYISGAETSLQTRLGTVMAFPSKTEVSPFGMFGATIRLHERVTAGVGALMLALSGARYDNVPMSATGNPLLTQAVPLGNLNGFVAAYELRVPVAVEVTDWLNIGVAWRPTFVNRYDTISVSAGGQKKQIAHEDLANEAFYGVQVGALIKPSSKVRIGLNYRSRTDVALHGTTAITLGALGGPNIQLPAAYVYSVPHHFGLGFEGSFLRDKLVVAADFKYFMTKDTAPRVGNKQLDAMSGHVGIEYAPIAMLPLRVGYFVGRSSTAPQGASALVIPPGVEHTGTVGAGLRFRHVDLGLTFGYGGIGSKVVQATPPGTYRAHTYLVSASAAVHI